MTGGKSTTYEPERDTDSATTSEGRRALSGSQGRRLT